jgi:hypothetical protein
MAAEATAQIVGLQFTATAQIIGQTATSQAIGTAEAVTQQARIDAQATSDQARQDAQATQSRADADARATQQRIDADATAEQQRRDAQSATEQALVFMQQTQSADATSTFTAMTMTAIPPHATLTQIAVNNEIALATKDVEKAELDLQQARDTNKIAWAIPLLVALGLMAMGAIWIWRESRWKVIKNDDGDVLGFGFHEQYINPHTLPGPVLDLKTKTMPMLIDGATQKEIILNEQKIRAIAAIPISPSAGGAQAFNMAFSSTEPRFGMLEEGDSPPAEVMTPEAMEAIEGDWKDE